MCIFNEDASVNNTKIFVGKTSDGKHQLTVYANSVDATHLKKSSPKNAMILPFPVPRELVGNVTLGAHKVSANADIVQVLDLTDYTKFFQDCEACFPQKNSMSRGMWLSSGLSDEECDLLEVVQIGGYNVSVARTLE